MVTRHAADRRSLRRRCTLNLANRKSQPIL